MKAEGSPLTPEWRRWLVENLLRGTAPRELVAALEKAGWRRQPARRGGGGGAARSPSSRGPCGAVGMQRKLEGLLDVYAELFQQTEAPPAGGPS